MTPIVRAASAAELPVCHAIRHQVFVLGQDVPQDLEIDGLDGVCDHVLVSVDGVEAGTARLRAVDGHGKAERVAVLAAFRGLGLGLLLMQALEERARARGWQELHLNAQWPVVPFYERMGYVGHGEPFDEAGIRHLAMWRRLA